MAVGEYTLFTAAWRYLLLLQWRIRMVLIEFAEQIQSWGRAEAVVRILQEEVGEYKYCCQADF